MKLVTPKWNETNDWWPKIERWIAAALDTGSIMFTAQEVRNGLNTRNMKLWLIFDGEELKACMVSLVCNYSVAKCLNLLAAGGSDVDDCLTCSPEIDAYAKTLDCQFIEFVGREGWKRKVADYGYRAVSTIYRKPI